MARGNDSAAAVVQQAPGHRGRAAVRVGLRRIVVHVELGQVRHQADQIEPTLLKTLSYLFHRNIMAALGDAPAHAIDMQRHVGEADIPDMHGQSRLRGLLEQRGDRLAAERGLKGKIGGLVDRSLQ